MKVPHSVFENGEPLEEERARAMAVTEAIGDEVSAHLDRINSLRLYSLGAGVGGLVLAVAAFFANLGGIAAVPLVLGLLGGVGGYLYTERTEPGVTVNGIKKGYWTGYAIPDDDGVVVYDATNSIGETTFNLERLKDDETVTDAKETIEDLQEFPVVMSRDEPLEHTFTNALETVQAEIENADQEMVEAPIVSADEPGAEALEFFAERATQDGGSRAPETVSTPPVEAAADVNALTDLEKMALEEDDASLEQLSGRSRQLVGELSGTQEMAIDILNDHLFEAADAFGVVSYNFYCPDCMSDDIETAVELTDPQSGDWFCSTCRSHLETGELIPRHKIKDDVVNPVWDQLWIEKDDQRREIYENIEDQKSELQEREFEQRREEIRTATDRIKDIRSKIRDLQTQAKAAEGKVEEIGDLMVKYDRLNEERKEQFQQDVEESFAEIDKETERILEETRNEEQERIEQAQKEAKEKAEMMHEEKLRRDIEKFAAEQAMEERRHEAEMELQADSIQKQELLETEGEFSSIDTINNFRQWKKDVPIIGGGTKYEGEN
ncbi:MAG: hypothetical protein ABEJ60_01785 [Halodesulfurarchaeum sp.]